MSKRTNIKINYMILEQILRVTGFYKNLVDEHEFLDVIFKQAKTGEIDSLFRDDEAKETALGLLEHITRVDSKYWSGEDRIELGIKCTNQDLVYDGLSIDNINLDEDNPFIDKELGEGYAYHGIQYQELLKNPMHLDFDEVYNNVISKKALDELEVEKEIENIETLYNIKGLLTVILLNIADEIELIDKANVYVHKKWEPYMEKSSAIVYKPKFVEFNLDEINLDDIKNDKDELVEISVEYDLVQTIIRRLFNLGIPFTFRDYFKKSFEI